MGKQLTALIVSENPPAQLTALPPQQYSFFVYQGTDLHEILLALDNHSYELVILDEATVGKDLHPIADEIKAAHTYIQVWGWLQNWPGNNTILNDTILDEIIVSSLPQEELVYRLWRGKQQYETGYNLHRMGWLAARLNSITDEQKLIKEAINLACSTFQVYGVAVATRSSLYASTADMPYLYKSSSITPAFQQIVERGQVQFVDHPSGIAVLHQATGGLVLPIMGMAIGIFGSTQMPLKVTDRPLYELFAHQFAASLNALQRQSASAKRAKLPTYLQQLAQQQNHQQIVDLLYEWVAEQVDKVIVWVEDAVKTTDDNLLDEDLPPHFHTFPIIAGKENIGGISVSSSDKDLDTTFIETLAYGAAQALAGRSDPKLEDMLKHAHLALFYVDKNGYVTFCSPYFSTFTGIPADEVLNKDVDALLERLSEFSNNALAVRQHLLEAVDEMYQTGNHAIIPLTAGDRALDVRLACIERGVFVGSIQDHPYPNTNQELQTPIFHILMDQSQLPFAQARSFINTLMDEYHLFRQNDALKLLAQVRDNLEETRQLWDNLHQLVKVETASHTLRYEENDIESLILKLLDSVAFRKHIARFRVESEPMLPGVNLNAPLVQQVLTNILHNALHYSPHGSPIRINLVQQSNEVQIEIHDDGDGISDIQFNKPFDLVAWSLHEKRSVSIDLYLSKMLLERHGGWLYTENEEGLTIVIGLPINGPLKETREMPAVNIQEAVLQKPKTQPRIHETMETPAISQGRVPERSLQTIMIIQGKTAFLTDYTDKLEERGYDVLTYTSVDAALSDLSLIRLDLILLDARMPGSDSLQVCSTIRQRTEIPIILVAESSAGDETAGALNLGADDFITSPISDAEFLARVNVIFKRQRLADRTSEPLQLGDLLIDFARREVFMEGEPVELTRIQYELLHTLIVNRGQVLTHQQLLEKVWGPEYQGETQYLWVNISRLRKKLEKGGQENPYINNIPSIGYMFKAP